MTTPRRILEQATADGLIVTLAENGSIRATGEQEVINRWRPLLKQHRAEIVNLLAVNQDGVLETFLERLKKSNTPTMGTALTASSALDSKGSTKTAHFHKNTSIKKSETIQPLPKWCRTDCPGLETIPLPNEGETAGCVHPVTGTWRRLEWLSRCPEAEKRTGHDRQGPATDHSGVTKAAGSTEEQSVYFAAAWPWIKEHKAALLAAGWTMAELVRRVKYRWPVGPWGLAWLPVWSKPGVVVTLGGKGGIVFTWRDGERTIKQTARPR